MLFGGSAFLRRPRPVKPSRCGILFNTAPLLFLFNWLHGIINLKKCQCFPAIFMQSFQPQPARAFDFSSSSQDKTARAGDWHGRLRAQRGDSPSAHFIRGRGKPRDEQKTAGKPAAENKSPKRRSASEPRGDFRFRRKMQLAPAYLTYSAATDFTVTDSRGIAPHSASGTSNLFSFGFTIPHRATFVNPHPCLF